MHFDAIGKFVSFLIAANKSKSHVQKEEEEEEGASNTDHKLC